MAQHNGSYDADAPEGEGERLVERFVEDVLNRGDKSAIPDLFARNYDNHGGLPGQPAGTAGVAAAIDLVQLAGADVHFSIEDVFSSGDRVAYRVFGSGEAQSDVATQGLTSLFTVNSVGIYRFASGRFVEHWGRWIIE